MESSVAVKTARRVKVAAAPSPGGSPYAAELRALTTTVRRRFGTRSAGVIEEAFRVAEAAHGPQRRTSGEPYITHPIAVAQHLAELGLDPDAVAAALLHDVVEDTGVDQAQIEAQFGPEVALLVAGVTKMGAIEMHEFAARSSANRGRGRVPPDALLKAEAEAENLRRMILASAADLRVLLIKLADRLHNMQTLDALTPERRERMARETLDIYAPLANRLGISRMKSELEDLALRVLDPEAYRQISEALSDRRHHHQVYLDSLVRTLDAALKEHDLTAEIQSRTKHIYSIYRKMQRKELGPEQIYDVLAVRLLVETVPDCYLALGVVHELWAPIPGEFDDYIGKRKNNLYQSLHTAVLGPGNRPLEVQIRTHEMHQVAEYGVAAHWAYKEGSAADKRSVDILKEVEALRRVLQYQEDDPTDPQAFIDSFKSEVLSDKVYVLTPKGAVVELPSGSTPVDFAYYIHSEVGHRCRGALVDGKMVSLDTPLQTSQTVKIITAKGDAGPSRDWLNPVLGYTTTAKAKDRIRQWFKKRARAEAIAAGREVLERQLRKLGLTKLKSDDVARQFDMERLEDFLAAVGRHEISAEMLGTRLLEDEATRALGAAPRTVTARPETSALGVSLAGVDAVSTHIAGCCHPLPGDSVVGYVTRGRGVTLHRADCRNIERTHDREPERFIRVNWEATRSQSYPVELRVTAVDRPGLVRDISEVLARRGVNMTQISANTSTDGMGVVTVNVELASVDQLVGLIDKVEQIDNVVEVHRPT